MKRKSLAFVLAFAMVVSSIPQQNVMRVSASNVQTAEGSTEAGSEEAAEVVPLQEENIQPVETETSVAMSETEAPVIVTEAPETAPPVIVTEAPETEPPVIVTEAPETEPPVIVTEAPETEAPVIVTEAPETEPPVIVTEAPETEKTETEPPVVITEAPETGEPVTDTETSASEAPKEESEDGSEQQMDEPIVIVEEPGTETEEATKALEDMLDFQILDTELKWLANTPEAIEFAQDLWTFETTCEGTEGTESTHLFDQTETGFAVTIASIADVNGTLYGYDQAIPEGDYVITFSFGNTEKEYPLSAVDFKDYGEPLNLEETAVMGEGYHYYTFMPSKTGNFCVSQTAGSYWMYDESLNQLSTGISEETGELYYELEEGKPYLIAASVPEEIGTAELSLKELEVEEVLEEQETEELLMADDGVLTVGEEIQLEEGNYTFSFTPEKDGCYYYNTDIIDYLTIYDTNSFRQSSWGEYVINNAITKVFYFRAGCQYTFQFIVSELKHPIKFVLQELSQIQNLSVGENHIFMEKYQLSYAIFEPVDTANYGVKMAEGGMLRCYSDYGAYIGNAGELEKGNKYICIVYSDISGENVINIQKIPHITDITLISSPYIISEKHKRAFSQTDFLEFKIDFEDGTFDIIRGWGNVEYYGVLNVDIVDKDTGLFLEEGTMLEEGKEYNLRCSIGNLERFFSVTAKNVNEILEKLPLGKEIQLEVGNYNRFIFTPEENEYYYYKEEQGISVFVYDEQSEYVKTLIRQGSPDVGIDVYYHLEKGHTYRFDILADSSGTNRSFTWNELTKYADLAEGTNNFSVVPNNNGYALFVPTKTASYDILVNNINEGTILDEDGNFVYTLYQFEKDKQYIFLIDRFDTTQYCINIKQIPEITDITLISENSILAGVYTGAPRETGYLKFELTFSDGTNKKVNAWDQLDYYGTVETEILYKSTYENIPADIILKEGEEYVLRVTVGNAKKEFSVVARKAENFLESFTTGNEKKIDTSMYYIFTPDTDGLYYMKTTDLEGGYEFTSCVIADETWNNVSYYEGQYNLYPLEKDHVYYVLISFYSDLQTGLATIKEVEKLSVGNEKYPQEDFAYELVIPESGKYTINVGSQEVGFYSSEDGEIDWFDGSSLQIMETGIRYWIDGYGYGEKISFEKAIEITGLKWETQPINVELLEGVESIDFSDFTVRISYSDGTEQIVPLGDKDTNGYKVDYSIYSKSDSEFQKPLDEWDLVAGDYMVLVEVEGYMLTFPIKIDSIKDAAKEELVAGTVKEFNALKQYEVFYFIPNETARYEISCQPRLRQFFLYDADMNAIEVDRKNDSASYLINLKAENIYYGLMNKGDNQKVTVSLNKATELQSITVSTKQKQFIAGLEYLTPGAIEVDTIYQDGEKSKLQGMDSDNRGTTCTYILDKDGEEYSLNEDLPIGEYQLVAKASGDPDIQDSTTIQAVAVNAGNLPEALEGQETTVALNPTGITLYRLTPRDTGEYKVDLGDRLYVEGRFYEQTEQGLERVDELIAGTTYLLDVSSLVENEGQQAVRFKIISEKEASEGWETSSGGNLDLNRETELVFRYAWDEVKYLFTPEESGNYTFRGIFTDENVSHGADIDIYEVDGAGEEHDYIGGCYGNVNNGQIGCTVELEKAKTYVCYIYSHENYSKMLFSVKKTPDNKVESIKIERKNNESEMVEMINPFDEQSFLFTIYYEDGDYDIEERSYLEEGTVETWTDIYGNQWQYQYSVTSENDTEKIYLLQMTGNGFSTEERFTEKKMSSLNAVELTEGQTFTQTFQSGESILNYYRITPKEDGEYALKLIPKQGEGSFQGVSIFKNGEERIWSYSQENANIRIRNLEKGQTYYLVMPIAEAENFQYSVSFEKAKTVAGIELIQDSTVIPADSYWLGEYVKDLHIQLTYADGTALTMKDGFETADGYGNSLELLEKSAGDDKIQITVFAEDYWDSKIYTIDRSQVKPITSGQTIAVPATWKDQAVYLFNVEQSGLYSLDVQNGEISAALFDSQHKEQLSADTTWSLEGGTSYYLHVYCMPNGANASYTLTKRSHTFGEWKVMSEATCTENGIRYRSCTDADCGYYDTEEVPALGHSFEEKSIEPTDTETGMRYQECTRCHRVEVLEILPITIPEVDTVIDQIEKLPDNAAQDEIKNAADAVAAIENEKLENGGAMDSIKALEEKAVTAQLAGNTQVEGILGLQVEGAGLTVLQYEEKLQGDTGAAKVSIVQSATDYSGHEELGGTKLYALDISMDIVNEKTNATVEENVEPITPIRITLDLPEEYQGKSFELYHMGTAGLEKVDYLMNPEQTQITFTTSSLSDFILKLTDCQGEHQYQENIVTNATCTAEGSKQMVCENCGYEKTEVIPPTGKHAYETIIDKDPTCGASGSQHEECMICHYARPAVNIPATGKHTWTTKVDQAATCGAAGSQHKECTVCGQKEGTETIPATGAHSWTTKVDKAATCGAAGSQHKECSVCGQKQAAETIPATGAHTWTTKVDQAATCGAAGSQHKECTVCGQRQAAEAIPATGAHHYVTTISKEATCGEAGRKYEECTVCHSQKGAETIPATNAHKFGSYKVTKEATVLAEGTKTRTCSVCGEEENVSIKKLRAKISLNVKKIPLKVKQSTTKVEVTYGKGDKIVSWKSSNRKVATVTSKGKITGKKAGKATITVKLKSGKSAKITVTVQKNKVKTTKLKLNKKSLTLKKGKKYQLNAAVTPVTSQEKVKFTSSNKKILTVSSKGKITAKKKGTAYVVVTSGSKTVRCKVKVK